MHARTCTLQIPLVCCMHSVCVVENVSTLCWMCVLKHHRSWQQHLLSMSPFFDRKTRKRTRTVRCVMMMKLHTNTDRQTQTNKHARIQVIMKMHYKTLRHRLYPRDSFATAMKLFLEKYFGFSFHSMGNGSVQNRPSIYYGCTFYEYELVLYRKIHTCFRELLTFLFVGLVTIHPITCIEWYIFFAFNQTHTVRMQQIIRILTMMHIQYDCVTVNTYIYMYIYMYAYTYEYKPDAPETSSRIDYSI